MGQCSSLSCFSLGQMDTEKAHALNWHRSNVTNVANMLACLLTGKHFISPRPPVLWPACLAEIPFTRGTDTRECRCGRMAGDRRPAKMAAEARRRGRTAGRESRGLPPRPRLRDGRGDQCLAQMATERRRCGRAAGSGGVGRRSKRSSGMATTTEPKNTGRCPAASVMAVPAREDVVMYFSSFLCRKIRVSLSRS